MIHYVMKKNSQAVFRFTRFSEAEFMQYRMWVGAGPSSKTWPRCASHLPQRTSTRSIPKLRSSFVFTFSFAIGAEKLGQPVPDSNLSFESKRSVPQHAH